MHSIPFPNEKFDAVVCGWTLSYSTKPQKALKEMLKKCKKGGLLAIGIEHAKITRKNDKIRQQDIRLIDSNVSKSRVNSVSDITRLLPKGCIKSLNYQYDAELKNMRKNDIFKKTGLHSSQVMITIKKK